MNTPPILPNSASSSQHLPPPQHHEKSGSEPKGKVLAVTSIVIAAIGILPLLIYFINCIQQLGTRSSYFGNGGNPLLILAMGFVGFAIHGIGLTCGIIGMCMGCKKRSLIGMIANGLILAAVLLFGFIAIAGA